MVNVIRTYFQVDYTDFKKRFDVNFKEYFSDQINFLKEHEKDGLVKIFDDKIQITDVGENFAPQIANVFDKYDPPTSSYSKRLDKIKKVSSIPS